MTSYVCHTAFQLSEENFNRQNGLYNDCIKYCQGMKRNVKRTKVKDYFSENERTFVWYNDDLIYHFLAAFEDNCFLILIYLYELMRLLDYVVDILKFLKTIFFAF